MAKIEIDPSGDVAVHFSESEYEAFTALLAAVENEIDEETVFDDGTAITDNFDELYSLREYITHAADAGLNNWTIHGFRDNLAPVIEDEE